MRADDKAADKASEEAPPVLRTHPTPQSVRSASLLTLALLACVYTLYFAKELLLPITMALLFTLLLQAPMRLLTSKLRLPGPVSRVTLTWDGP